MTQAILNFYDQLTSSRYGAMELNRFIGPNLLRGLIISFLAHALIVSSPYIIQLFKGEEEIPPPNVVVVDVTQLTKLKAQQNTPEQIQIAMPKLEAPTAAIPIPVDEDIIEADQPLIKSQSELTYMLAQPSGGEAGLELKPGDIIQIKEEAREERDEPGEPIFRPVEVPPQPLESFSPVPSYPEMAKSSGVKGKVIVQCYVDKTGVVKKFIIKSAQPKGLGFEEEVEKVIMKWKFTPAIQNGKPIGVWVEIPFNFEVER